MKAIIHLAVLGLAIGVIAKEKLPKPYKTFSEVLVIAGDPTAQANPVGSSPSCETIMPVNTDVAIVECGMT